MGSHVIGIDIGTTKIAAVSFDIETGASVVVSEQNKSSIQSLTNGRHEQAPQRILNTCLRLLGQLVRDPRCPGKDWVAIGFSGQMHGVMLVSQTLKPMTNLITWCDQRSAELTAGITSCGWASERTGCHLQAGYGGATLSWLARNRGLASGEIALSIADYIALSLKGGKTQSPQIDRTHAASWGVFDLEGNCWDAESVERIDIPATCLPSIAADMCVFGNVGTEMARWIGLPPGKQVNLLQPVGDNQASFIGSCGVDTRHPLLNLGTGGQLSLPLEKYLFTPEAETRPLPGGDYILVCASLCGGRAYAALNGLFSGIVREFTGETPCAEQMYDVMNRLARFAAEHSAKARLFVDTRFAGSRLQPQTRGNIGNIDTENFTAGELAYGVLCGMIDELIEQVGRERLSKYSLAHISGNALKRNSMAQQLAGERLGMRCVCPNCQEEAATGAALLAARALEKR